MPFVSTTNTIWSPAIEQGYGYGIPSAEPADGSRALGGPDFFALALLLVGIAVGGLLWRAGQTELAAIVGGAFMAGAFFISPFIGLCVLVAAVPTEHMTVISEGSLTFMRALGLLLVAAYLPRLLLKDLRRCFQSHIVRWQFLLPLWAVLLLPFAQAPLAGAIAISVTVQVIGMAFLIAAVPRNFAQLRLVCLVLVASAAAMGLFAGVFGAETLYTGQLGQGRLSAGGNPNELAFALGVGLFATPFAWHNAKPWMKLALLGMGLCTVAAIGLTSSRGTWVAIVLAMVAGPMLSRRVPMKLRLGFLMAMVVLGVAGFLMVWYNVFGETGRLVQERLKSLFGEEAAGGTSGGRLEWIWPHYLEVIGSNVLMGGGPGKTLYDNLSPHNDILSAGATGGIVGIFLYLGLFVVAARESLRNRDEWLRLSCLMLLVYAFTSGFFHTTASDKATAVVLGVIAATANLGLCGPRPAPLLLRPDGHRA